MIFGQDRVEFAGFGFLPKHIPNYLFKDVKEAKTDLKKLSALDTIATIYVRTDNADSLAYYGLEMRKIISKKAPTSYDLKAFYYAGLGKQRLGLLDAATHQFFDGLSWSYTDTIMRQRITLELARTYLLKSEKERTRTILDTLSSKITDTQLKANMDILEGDYAYENADFPKAKEHYNNAIFGLQNNSSTKKELLAKIGLGKILLQENNIDDALELFIDLKEKALNNGYYDLYIKCSLYEGRIYTHAGNYEVAEVALGMSYSNTLQWNRMELQQQVIQELYRLYALKEDYENAYALATQNIALVSRISEEQNAKVVRELEITHETFQKEKQIDALEASQLIKESQIKRQKTIKNAFLIGFVIILIPVISFLVVYYQKLQAQSKLNAQQEKLNEQEMKSLLQTQQLEIARASMKAQNEERGRIARELHDSIGGNLGAIKLQMSLNGNNTNTLVLEQIDKTYEQVREISHSLVPKEFSEQLFTDLVKRHITTFSEGQDFEVNFIVLNENDINDQNSKLQVSLFNIIKELLTNAHKHAGASSIDIQLNFDENEKSLDLLYEDNGKGFDVSKTSKGIGLNNLTYRVKELNGVMNIDSAINRGTVISISLLNITKNEAQ